MVIAIQGDEGDSLYIILIGSVSVIVSITIEIKGKPILVFGIIGISAYVIYRKK